MKDKIMFGITAIAISAVVLALSGKKEKSTPKSQMHSPYIKH